MAEDVIEGVCKRVGNMGEQLVGDDRYTKMTSKEVIRIENSMENYCQTVIEEHEEDVKIKLFQSEMMKRGKINRWLCAEMEEICTENYFETQSVAVLEEASKSFEKHQAAKESSVTQGSEGRSAAAVPPAEDL